VLANPDYRYIDDPVIALGDLVGKRFVGIDPNKSNLVYATSFVSGPGGERRISFRYTQNQRRREIKYKIYQRLREKKKLNTTIGDKTVKEWEATVSASSHKTVIYENYCEYIRLKNLMNWNLLQFYQQTVFRKLQWNTFMNTQRSEALMLNRFCDMFGTPNDVVIGFGDWSEKMQMKHKEPSKSKGKFLFVYFLYDKSR
jgi:hypothetical protein